MVNLNIISVADALIDYDASTGTELATVNTTIDTIHEETHEVLLELEHESMVFPSNTNLTCTLVALNTANEFSNWVEIADNATTKFSVVFALCPGHISVINLETLSEEDTIYMVEIAYGEAVKVPLTAMRFAGRTKFQAPSVTQRFYMEEIPIGEKVYYRMKTATAVADTALVNFRYHCH